MKVLVLNRKLLSRIMYRIMLLAVCAASFMYASENAIGAASVPIKNMVVIIDPGHGGIDGGAVGKTGTIEDNINLAIAIKLRRLIEQAGGVALMIREDDTGLYAEGQRIRDKKNEDLRNRFKQLNNSDADIFISIHLNSFPQSQYYGSQTFYKTGDENSKKLAEYIQAELLTIMDRGNKREAKPKKDLYLFKGNTTPGVLVECGFLSNHEEEQLLKQDHYQEKLAWCMFSGLVRYFETEKKVE